MNNTTKPYCFFQVTAEGFHSLFILRSSVFVLPTEVKVTQLSREEIKMIRSLKLVKINCTREQKIRFLVLYLNRRKVRGPDH